MAEAEEAEGGCPEPESVYKYVTNSLYLTSDDLPDRYCDPCHDNDGVYLPVEEYCPTCVEFYCSGCSRSHGRLALTRNHVTIRGSDMPTRQEDRPIRYQQCSLHVAENCDKFCFSHRIVVCRLCLRGGHGECDTKSIIESCSRLGKNDKDALEKSVIGAKDDILSTKTLLENNMSDIENDRKAALEKSKEVYTRAKSELKVVHEATNKQIIQTSERVKDSLKHKLSELKQVLSFVDQTSLKLKKYRTVDPRAFLNIQQIVHQIRDDACRIHEITNDMKKVNLSFTADPRISQYLSSVAEIGQVKETYTKYDSLRPVRDIVFPVIKLPGFSDLKLCLEGFLHVKIAEDRKDCDIQGIDVTPNGRIIIADANNEKVKVFSSEKEYQSSLRLKCIPSDLAVVNDEEVLVTLATMKTINFIPENHLYSLNIKGSNVSVQQTIQVGFPVRAVTVYQDKIIASCWDKPSSIKLLDRSGYVYWSRKSGTSPQYNTIFFENNKLTVIVTDFATDKITKLDGETGDIIKECEVPGKGPIAVCTDDSRHIYVCYNKSNEVCVWTSELTNQRILLSCHEVQESGIRQPFVLAYDLKNSKIIMTNEFSNYIHFFKL